jgi:hypothetical protein
MIGAWFSRLVGTKFTHGGRPAKTALRQFIHHHSCCLQARRVPCDRNRWCKKVRFGSRPCENAAVAAQWKVGAGLRDILGSGCRMAARGAKPALAKAVICGKCRKNVSATVIASATFLRRPLATSKPWTASNTQHVLRTRQAINIRRDRSPL